MKRFLLFLFLLNSSFLFAQNEWAPKGATWYYNALPQFWKEGFIQIQYIGDTVLEQKNCKLLQEKFIAYDFVFQKVDTSVGSTQITYYSNNVVYLYKHNKFYKIFDFNASVGDSWELPSNEESPVCDSIGAVIVDSVGTIDINSETLRLLSLKIKPGYKFGYEGIVIEKIGNLGFMYPNSEYCIPDAGGGNSLRCYHDDSFYYQTGTIDCDALPTGINDDVPKGLVKLFPNPVGDELKLVIPNNLTNNPIEIVIVNISGMGLRHYMTTADAIDVSALPPGIYFANIILRNTVSYVKFIKR